VTNLDTNNEIQRRNLRRLSPPPKPKVTPKSSSKPPKVAHPSSSKAKATTKTVKNGAVTHSSRDGKSNKEKGNGSSSSRSRTTKEENHKIIVKGRIPEPVRNSNKAPKSGSQYKRAADLNKGVGSLKFKEFKVDKAKKKLITFEFDDGEALDILQEKVHDFLNEKLNKRFGVEDLSYLHNLNDVVYKAESYDTLYGLLKEVVETAEKSLENLIEGGLYINNDYIEMIDGIKNIWVRFENVRKNDRQLISHLG